MAEGRPNVSQAQRPSECVTQGGDSCWSDTSVTEYSRGSSVIPPKWGHRAWPEGQAHGLSLHGPIQALAADMWLNLATDKADGHWAHPCVDKHNVASVRQGSFLHSIFDLLVTKSLALHRNPGSMRMCFFETAHLHFWHPMLDSVCGKLVPPQHTGSCPRGGKALHLHSFA